MDLFALNPVSVFDLPHKVSITHGCSRITMQFTMCESLNTAFLSAENRSYRLGAGVPDKRETDSPARTQ